MSGVGFYGKLPGLGDFVRRRLPSDFVERWDRHFQRALDTGRRELGEQWTAAWRQGPAFCFVLRAQACGNGAWCGLIGPAADRLGRAFPMVVAAPCGGDVARMLGNDAWFDALERVYRSAQHEALSVETFDARVAALPRPLADAHDRSALWRELPCDSGQWLLELGGGAVAGTLLNEAWQQVCMRPGSWCLWWTAGASRLLATRGLPRNYAALLEATRAHSVDVYGLLDGPGDDFRRHVELPPPARDYAASPSGAHAPLIVAAQPAHDTAQPADTILWLDQGRTLVLSADAGPHDPRRLAARGIRETLAGSAPDPASQRAGLLSLHRLLQDQLYQAWHAVPGTADTPDENGAALVVRFEGAFAHVLRVGAAALWHWRRGQFQAPFVERATGAGGEFDDLLFGDAWLEMPGVGTTSEPDFDEAVRSLEAGDCLLLLVTRELVQLPRDCFAEALALPTCDDARVSLASRAGLGPQSALWPFAVVEVRV